MRYGWTDTFAENEDDASKRSTLPQVERLRETVGLEIVFVERPVDDPLLREQALWEGVDTVGAIRPELRKHLRENGFRVGQSSSTPNPAIESMLGLRSQSTGIRTPVKENQLAGRRVFRPTGGETEVQTSRYFPELLTSIAGTPSSEIDVQNARCVFRVKAERLEDGWARLEFTPEIHHGRHGWRPIATGRGWKGATSQKIHRLYDQRFSLMLNVGEMAVITADSRQPDSLATKFFIEGTGSNRLQRVLIIRLADVGKTPSVIRKSRKER